MRPPRHIARLLLLASFLPSAAAPAAAQPAAGKSYRVGVLSGWSPATDSTHALRQALEALGYVVGRNLTLEERYSEGRSERLRAFAEELVNRKVDVIVAGNVLAARAASAATRTIPIVIAGGDAVGTGLVKNLARPGGNLTGVATLATELTGKRLTLLKEAMPGISRVAVLFLRGNPNSEPAVAEATAAAARLSMQLQPVAIGGAGELEAAFSAIKAAHAQAVLVVPSALFRLDQARVIELAHKHALPTTWEWREAALDGALLSYGASNAALWQGAALFVDRILKGAKPGELPLEQPTKLDLVINLKTAKALGIVVPPSVMVRADEILR